jgi:hypothetical protein
VRGERESRASKLRRQAAVSAYIAVNGMGKTWAMVNDTLPSLREGRPVFGTVTILDASTGEPHPLWFPLTDAMQLLDTPDGCDILLDEVSGSVDSRASMSLPAPIRKWLQELRRRDQVLRWTGLRWGAADTILRSATQAVTRCRAYLPTAMYGDDGAKRLWPSRRLFSLVTFDARDFEDSEAARATKLQKLRPLAREWVWRPGTLAERSYRTLDPVLTFAHIAEGGSCGVCGGSRPRPKCTCDDGEQRARELRRRKPAVVAVDGDGDVFEALVRSVADPDG